MVSPVPLAQPNAASLTPQTHNARKTQAAHRESPAGDFEDALANQQFAGMAVDESNEDAPGTEEARDKPVDDSIHGDDPAVSSDEKSSKEFVSKSEQQPLPERTPLEFLLTKILGQVLPTSPSSQASPPAQVTPELPPQSRSEERPSAIARSISSIEAQEPPAVDLGPSHRGSRSPTLSSAFPKTLLTAGGETREPLKPANLKSVELKANIPAANVIPLAHRNELEKPSPDVVDTGPAKTKPQQPLPSQSPAAVTEGHQANPALSAPAEQIVDLIRAPAQSLLDEVAAAKPALKSLKFELKPEVLGVVHVTLKLAGGRMEISIEAQKQDTAALLKSDNALVEQLVRTVTAGGDVSSVTVNIGNTGAQANNENNWTTASGEGSRQQPQQRSNDGNSPPWRNDEASGHETRNYDSREDRTDPRMSGAGHRVV